MARSLSLRFGSLLLLHFLFLFPAGALRAQEECTIGVASGGATPDGRPLLWKNRDTSADSRNVVELRHGKRFAFLGLVNPGSANVWAGVNEAGLALVNAQSADLGEKGAKGPGNGLFLARSLGSCADLEELRVLLERTNRTGRSTHTSYGAFDARGRAGIFEVKARSFVFFDARDPRTAPGGWIVRTNFAFTGDGKRGGGTARYLRARFLWERLHRRGELEAEKVLRICARDLASPEGKPYPLPFPGKDDRLPPFSIETFSTIDRFTTRAAVVFRGVKKGEDPAGTVMWCIAGEPLFSVAVPLWVSAGEPPSPLRGRPISPILEVERALKGVFYVRLFREGKLRAYLDTRPLPAVLGALYDAEDRIFAETRRFLRAGGPSRAGRKAAAALEKRAARAALEAMRGVLRFWKDRAPLRVGVFSGPGAPGLAAAHALAALRIDPGLAPFPVDAKDLLEGALESLDVLLFPAGPGADRAWGLGEAARKRVESFVLHRGGGCVGIGGGVFLAAACSLYPRSLLPRERPGRKAGVRGRVGIEAAPSGKEIFPEIASAESIPCEYDPTLSPFPDLSGGGFRALLKIRDGASPPPSGEGWVRGRTFAVCGQAGKGRFLLFAGRPEASPGLRWMAPRAARWAAGRPPASYPEGVRRIPGALPAVGPVSLLSALPPSPRGKAPAGGPDALADLPGDGPSLRLLGFLRSLDPKRRARAARLLAAREFLPGLPDLEEARLREKDPDCRDALDRALRALAPFRPLPGIFPEAWYGRSVRILGALTPGRTRRVRDERPGLHHHFTVTVPPGTERLVLGLQCVKGERNFRLFARRGGPALPGAPGVFQAGGKLSPGRTLVVDSPAPGRWFVCVEADFRTSVTTEEWGRRRFVLPPAFRGVEYVLTAYVHPLAYRPAAVEGYYRDLFMDSGVALTSRRSLPAAALLGLSMEYLALPNRGAREEDKALQVKLLGGWKEDPNGILLYPDGAPRFRCVYVNGGSATRHGASLGPAGRKAYRRFFAGGGSYTGSCAGAYLPTLAPRRQKLRPQYLHIWPGHVQPTGLLKTPTGLVIPRRSPLLRFSDFGGDSYVARVYHNGGCFADDRDPWFWARGTEVLARYDYPARPMHGKVACWAWKPSPREGRLVVIGSHPEGVWWGEQRDLMAAVLRYALEGTGRPRVKGELKNGSVLRMEDNSRPGREKIGDGQYHHFLLRVPPGTKALAVRVRAGRSGRKLGLFLRRGGFAFRGAPGTIAAPGRPGPEVRVRVDSPEPGAWYVGVKGATVVRYERVPWGWRYTGNLDVLDGVPYRIEAVLE